MPAKLPKLTIKSEKHLRDLGQQLRDRRKQLRLSAVATAEAAGLSRVTLYRIEKGEASVVIGAYLSVILALGLDFQLLDKKEARPKTQKRAAPPNIRIAEYPQLKKLAWQLNDATELSAKDALDLYERNWRHVDQKAMTAKEKDLLKELLASFGRERLLV